MSSNKANHSSGPGDSSTSASNHTSSSTSTTTKQASTSASNPQYPGLGANFAHDPKAPVTVNYDQEAYMQLMAEEEAAAESEGKSNTSNGGKKKKDKTPTQIYREKWVRRALNPAISDPRGEPSSIDFECAENRRVSDRF